MFLISSQIWQTGAHLSWQVPVVCPAPSPLSHYMLSYASLIYPARPGPVTLQFVILGIEPSDTCSVLWEVYKAP